MGKGQVWQLSRLYHAVFSSEVSGTAYEEGPPSYKLCWKRAIIQTSAITSPISCSYGTYK